MIFGTDGIRARPGHGALAFDSLIDIGRAYAGYMRRQGCRGVLLGRDTRHSGLLLENIVSGTLAFHGLGVSQTGVVSTPALAACCKLLSSPGIVVTASHNPAAYNGLKFITPTGKKESTAFEQAIASLLSEAPQPRAEDVAAIRRRDLSDLYLDHLRHHLKAFATYAPLDLRLLVDTANGAAGAAAHIILPEVAQKVDFIHDAPDGNNINDGVGSEFVHTLAARAKDYDYIIAFDGDGDRLRIIDGKGMVYTGDVLLYCLAMCLRRLGHTIHAVAGTIMTSLQLEDLLRRADIKLVRSDVGDRRLMEAMENNSIMLGAESSGHVIFYPYLPTGDGLFVAALFVLLHREYRKAIMELAHSFSVQGYSASFDLHAPVTLPELKHLCSTAFPGFTCTRKGNSLLLQQNAGEYGVVRLSGTEPKIRLYGESLAGSGRELVRAARDALLDAGVIKA